MLSVSGSMTHGQDLSISNEQERYEEQTQQSRLMMIALTLMAGSVLMAILAW
jgi:hypothetical protein